MSRFVTAPARRATLALAVSSVFLPAMAFAAPLAAAPAETGLEGIVVTADRPGSATYEAPTQSVLDAGQPESLIGQHYIENNLPAAANFTDIIHIAPSVADTTPNGKGNAESLNLSIRGFQDGQFNVTFDGIPWNDSNDFTHHSTSYFTANTIGKVLVDRGPGTAAQIGNATFGGTVALQSRDPLEKSGVSAGLTLGTWRTNDYDVSVNTGTMGESGTRAMLTLTSLNSDGAMSNNAQQRKNVFLKVSQPLGGDTSLTAVAMYNTVLQNVSQFGTTQQQLAQFGPQYSLNTLPSSDAYFGFNFDDIHTDFEYLQLKTRLGDVKVDNKAYTYAYYHRINETNDPSLSQGSLGQYIGCAPASATSPANACDLAGAPYSPNVTAAAGQPGYNDVAGQKGFNNYRSLGDVLRLSAEAGPGTVRSGLWVDYQWNDRVLWDVDWTLGGSRISIPANPTAQTATNNPNTNGFQRYLHDDLTTIDPFVEYEFHAGEALTVTPGVRYSTFQRKIDAVVNPGTGGPTSYSHTWSGAQPSVYANYRTTANSSVYAQYARGFLAPKDKLAFNTSTAAADAFNPQRTNNFQAGGSWKSDALTLAADVYDIKFSNYFAVVNHGAGLTPVGGGSAVFRGFELEGTWAMGMGVSLYGNYTHNSQKFADGEPVPLSPDGTWALGLIYDAHNLYGSLMAKHVGTTVQPGNQGPVNFGNAVGTGYNMAGYTLVDLSLGYNLKDPLPGMRNARVQLNVADMANNRSVYYVYNANIAGNDDFMTLPGRSYMLRLSADF
jgi:iron complex outermembrane receptor protein